MKKVLRAVLFLLVLPPSVCFGMPYYGKYVGTVKVEWLIDGRTMRLLDPFVYVDPQGLEWMAPAGSEVDGASIPKFAWSVIGGPFEGKYRNASVIHDVACDQKRRSWEVTHEAFYNAMLASEVEPVTARIMYAAVYHFGPRWKVKLGLKETIQLSVKSFMDKIQSPYVQKRVASFQNGRPGIIQAAYYFEQPQLQPRLETADFAKLKTLIEQRENSPGGAMSLEEIRNYFPET